ncbi:hypothetical protein ES703_90672 [subsurface metagenome]|nr:hypothetical protein [candidate division WOR-3 bacterium]
MRKIYILITFIPVILLSERLDIVEIGHLEGKGYYNDIKIDGKYGYIAAGKGGIVIVDLADPDFPKKIGEIESMDYTYSLDIQGFKLFMADGKAGVRIFDIRDKENLEQRSFIPTRYSSFDIKVSGQYGYVAEGEGGFRIIDISKVDFPSEIARFNGKINIRALDIENGYAYLADSKGIIILDISNPDSLVNPIWIKTIDSVNNILSDGRWLFASGGDRDFIVSNVALPRYSITQKIPGDYKEIKDLSLSGFHLYVAKGDFGISILNLLVPFSPEVVNHTLVIEEAIGIYASGNLLFVTAGYDGLNVYQITEE